MNVTPSVYSTPMGERTAYNGMLTGPSIVVEQELTPPAARTLGRLGIFVGRKTSGRSLLIVFRQLALLIETGIDIAEAIELVANSCRQVALQQCLLQILDDINS